MKTAPAIKQQILELAREGKLSAAEIARETGVSRSQVFHVCHGAGQRVGVPPPGTNWNGEIGPRGMDYNAVHGMAQMLGRPVNELIALTSRTDPFFVGVPYRVAAAEWFKTVVWAKYGAPGMNGRRIHYLLLSTAIVMPDGRPYENTLHCLGFLGRASLAARYLDLIPFDAMTDERNTEPMIFADHLGADPNAVQRLNAEVINHIGIYEVDRPEMPALPFISLSNIWAIQKYIVEVWIEKSTQNDWLVRLCRKRGVNLVVGGGEQSEVRCRELALRAAKYGAPVRILYLSDFDPGGRSMPKAVARKIEFTLAKFGLKVDLQLIPIGLTPEQCRQYSLPRIPIKDSERRKGKFEKIFGVGATELDAMEALHPGELARMLNAELDKYLDRGLSDRVTDLKTDWEIRLHRIREAVRDKHREAFEELQASFKEIADTVDDINDSLSEWQEEAEDLWNEIAAELEAEIPDLSDVEVPQSEATGETEKFRLFDSTRDYLTQMDFYNQWREGEEADPDGEA